MTHDPNNKSSTAEQEESKKIDLAFNNQVKDMTSSVLICTASAAGMLLLWLDGPAALAVMLPALAFSTATLARSWQLARMTRRRSDRRALPASDLRPEAAAKTAASTRNPHDV